MLFTNDNAIQIKFDDDVFIAYTDADSVSRCTLIDLGGKLIATSGDPSDELRHQLWLVQSRDDDTYWIGDDWYSNVDARVRRAYKSPF